MFVIIQVVLQIYRHTSQFPSLYLVNYLKKFNFFKFPSGNGIEYSPGIDVSQLLPASV